MASEGARATLARARDLLLVAGCLIAVVVAFRELSPPAPEPAGASSAKVPASAEIAATTASADGRPPLPGPSLHLTDRDCSFEDRGLGDYERKRAGMAEVLVRAPAVMPDGSYDLVLHFHGGLALDRVLAPLAKPIVIATIDKGSGSSDYAGLFPTRRSFDALLSAIDAVVSETTGIKSHAARLLLSSFSAGFEAVRGALLVAADEPALTGVMLLDSLYGSYVPGSHRVAAEPLAPFEAAARRALDAPRFAFILTHSEVPTDGYANTAEVATTLLERLVVRASVVRSTQERGLRRVAEERCLIVRGYAGGDKGAHCGHLGLAPELVDRWRGCG